MQFISAQCPHCGKELQLPDDAQQVVCMYCAKPIDVQQVLHAQEDTESYRALLRTAKELMKDDVVAYKANIQAVNNHGYPEAFQAYVEKLAPALRAFCVAAEASTAQRAAEEYSLFLMERFLELFQKLQVKENDTTFFDYRYTVVAFLIPAILEQGHEATEALADQFLEKWNKQYPKKPLGKARYDEISHGFRQRLCFITTAVCEFQGKADDCYELTTFRKFRDDWLAKAPGGPRGGLPANLAGVFAVMPQGFGGRKTGGMCAYLRGNGAAVGAGVPSGIKKARKDRWTSIGWNSKCAFW